MYTYTQQYRNSTYMKLSLQATLKWAAQRMHSKVIKLVMHNANTTPPLGSAQSSALPVSRQHLRTVGKVQRRLPSCLKHRTTLPFYKILQSRSRTTSAGAMIKKILHLKLPLAICRRSKLPTRHTSCTLPYSSLKLRHMEHVMHSPV